MIGQRGELGHLRGLVGGEVGSARGEGRRREVLIRVAYLVVSGELRRPGAAGVHDALKVARHERNLVLEIVPAADGASAVRVVRRANLHGLGAPAGSKRGSELDDARRGLCTAQGPGARVPTGSRQRVLLAQELRDLGLGIAIELPDSARQRRPFLAPRVTSALHARPLARVGNIGDGGRERLARAPARHAAPSRDHGILRCKVLHHRSLIGSLGHARTARCSGLRRNLLSH